MLERGERVPRVDTLVKLAGSLAVKPRSPAEWLDLVTQRKDRPQIRWPMMTDGVSFLMSFGLRRNQMPHWWHHSRGSPSGD